MAIRIITDSASDVSQERAKQWGIRVLPLTVRFGEEEFLDGVTLSSRAFYERLVESDEIPKTSQIPPFVYEQAFAEAVEAGDEVLCLCLSSGVSGSWHSACLAAERCGDRVSVVDTRHFCISEYVIVQRAVQLRDAGLCRGEIVSRLQTEIGQVHIIALFDTLEYLKLGGRLSAASAMAGQLLSIKPVLTIRNGVVEVIGKARGSKRGNNLLRQAVEALGGIDFTRPVCLAYSGFSDETLQKYVRDSAVLYEGNEEKLQYATVGATIGTYAGPGAIALAFFAKP